MQTSQPAPLFIRRVAVCGAGVMGAQIAAHCVNAGVPVVLFDLADQVDTVAGDSQPTSVSNKSGIVLRAIAQLKKIKPAPLGIDSLAKLITPANYETDLDLLADCDLVIEAIAERLDWKRDLYHKLAPALNPQAIIASNTSGLSITALSQALPKDLQHRFCGVHFFNPPRYMPLVELIPTQTTKPALLDHLETFLVSRLGKGVVRAKDTPNFIGNRIGVFGIVSIFHHTEAFGLPYELVDELTGVRLGRAKSGTFRTADVVGLDTLAHVIGTMQDQLQNDPFHDHFALPAVVSGLIKKGALGQKTKAGFYRKEGKNILRLDPLTGGYVPSSAKAADEVISILKERDPGKRLQALHDCAHPQAQFLWAVLRDIFHYSAVHLADIADSARELDLAMKWGFGHQQGPFEIWQAAGWQKIVRWINEDIIAGNALSPAPLPSWVTSGPVWEKQAVHTSEGSYSAATSCYQPRSALPVYKRQIAAPRLVGEGPAIVPDIVHENDALMCWTLPAPHPQDVLIVSFKTKMHTLSPDVVRGLVHAIELAEQGYKAMVIGQLEEPFSAGADLKAMLPAFESGGAQAVASIQQEMQDAFQRLRYAQVPVVAALAGMALGGGCELAVQCARRVAHFETYIGLVEAGIGLLPGAGGTAWCARRAAELQARSAPEVPLLAFLNQFAQSVATARVSSSALDARNIGYLLDSDPIVMQRYELLYVAVREAAQLAEQGWRPPLPTLFPVAGRDAIATLKAQLVNMHVGGYISDHDFHVAQHITYAICGGDIDPGSLVDEAWMLNLERETFLGLLAHPKTLERITGLLQTGKPVRN